MGDFMKLASLAALGMGMSFDERPDPQEYGPRGRCIFGGARLLIGEPPKKLTKRQKRRLRGRHP